MSTPRPLTPNEATASLAVSERALSRTADVLQKLDKIRRTLELPAEQLPIVIETYGAMIDGVTGEIAREERAKRTLRVPLTLQSETTDYKPMKVCRGKVFTILVRPGFLSFRFEDLAIHGDRTRWMVHDVKVGNRQQFLRMGGSRSGPVAGTEFGPGGICAHLELETCQASMDLALEIEYVGPEADGELFEATLVGTASEH